MDAGARLRQARESRDLSIADISAATRIQPHILDALERNDLSAIPAGPYARGFVSAFARAVGLDVNDTVREFFAPFQPPPPAVAPVAASGAWHTVQWRTWGPGLGGVALAAVIGALFINRTPAPHVPEPGAVGTSGTRATSAPSQPGPGGTDGTTHARGTPAPSSGDHGSVPVVVVLETIGPSWVAATVDGERRLYQIIPRGTTLTLRGAREITLRVGNAGAVRWGVNGRAPDLMGAPGEVRSVRLSSGS